MTRERNEVTPRRGGAPVVWRVTYVLRLAAALAALVARSDVKIDLSSQDGLWFGVLVYVSVASMLIEPFYSGGSHAQPCRRRDSRGSGCRRNDLMLSERG